MSAVDGGAPGADPKELEQMLREAAEAVELAALAHEQALYRRDQIICALSKRHRYSNRSIAPLARVTHALIQRIVTRGPQAPKTRSLKRAS